MGNSHESLAQNGKRGSAPRRRRTDVVATDRLRVLLAKLLASFLGALLGFFIAHLVAMVFASPFQRLLDSATANLSAAEQELTRIEPEFIKAREDYGRYEGTAESTKPDPAGDAIGGPSAVEPAPAGADNAVDGFARAQYEASKQKFIDLRKQRDRLMRDKAFWEAQIEEYQHNINLLDLLSAAVVLILVVAGYAMHPLLLRVLEHVGSGWAEFFSGPEPRAVQAVMGFFAGLILAIVVLLAIFNVFSQSGSAFSSPPVRLLFGAFVVIVLGIAGAIVGVAYFSPPAAAADLFAEFRKLTMPHLLDTSVIIDGRIHDVAATGFLNVMLVVTNSVLREMQNMSDSADERKRAKGRRGLELLRKMQDDPRLDVRVYDDAIFDTQAHGTDEQLILVAQAMDGVVVTNDYNLNRVAAIRDVRVINVNALAKAVKTNNLPGDLIMVHIINRGKQRGQGVAYLDDGTMVVVEDGELHLKQMKWIKLTSVTQTEQGRLIFGRVDLAEEEQPANGN